MITPTAVEVLSALAHEGRLKIFRYLIQLGVEGATAGTIGNYLSLSASTLSFHLNALKQAELVRSRRDGRTITYTADFKTMNDTMAYLVKNCCSGEVADIARES